MLLGGKKVRSSGVPPASRVNADLASAYFSDAYQIMQSGDDRSALDIALQLAATAPPWFDFLMSTRNRIVGWLGLKNLGRLSAIDRDKPHADYKVGDRVGIFSIVSMSDDEVVLGDDDKHLRAHVSVYKERGTQQNVTLSTVVHVHNFLGRAYLFFVIPAHRLIVPPLLARLAD